MSQPAPSLREIHCCGCAAVVKARLTNGLEVYSHRHDLAELPFWRCDACGNHVGCHHKTDNPTLPLGVIPTADLRNARRHIHAILDPLWEKRGMQRSQLYARLSEVLGRQYHTADLRDLEEARTIYRAVQAIIRKGSAAA